MSMADSASGLDDDQLETVYGWVDQVPLTRPKKSIARDFADGVLVAEMIRYYFPRLVELHNYTASSNTKKKISNWRVLNRKVLNKLHFELGDDVLHDLTQAKPYTIEKVLIELKTRIDNKLKEEHMAPPPPVSTFRAKESDQPEADQHFGSKGRGAKGKNPSSKASIEVPPPPFERVTYKNLGRNDAAMPGNVVRHPPVGGTRKERDLALMYEEKEQECLAKGETIAMLQAKTRRLEHLLHLKDIRLEELQTQIEQLRPTGGLK
ncbi:sperm flagellar protein 1-like isoform X2 [Mizuhopecten yessoensis]|uniref:Sperm flagellar protein 1 n=1 Tax=Mizuhopecten yessoensis TaxID=6573 RepID=A0A210QQI1_MIZYE|nr:sperm flagellar protein 1-like isoform X2 [Mizuhopecten yessoensis]OWF50992.1 Sperm flagellar protein 1 [Mizuhopecten yessoensis]